MKKILVGLALGVLGIAGAGAAPIPGESLVAPALSMLHMAPVLSEPVNSRLGKSLEAQLQEAFENLPEISLAPVDRALQAHRKSLENA